MKAPPLNDWGMGGVLAEHPTGLRKDQGQAASWRV
jgi:hypothetical protein